ncbi:hypothetical protein BH10ACT7_BH10ACT7_02570 [soil metagenome]
MTDTADHASGAARSVFAGMVPNVQPEEAPRDRSRVAKGVFSTVPILLVGSMAAMTLNLTGPVEHANAKPIKPKGVASELGKTIRGVVSAAASAITSPAPTVTSASVSAPATYRVSAGDTISDIAGRYGLSTASVLALNGLGWSSLIFPGQELKLTSDGTIPEPVAQAAPVSSGRYTIVAGDTISAIAARFGVSTLSVLSANGLGWASIIYPGQTLAIPGVVEPGTEPVEEIVAVEEVLTPEPEVEAPVEVAPPVVEAPPAPPPAPAVSGSHTVVSGDTLSGIAARYGIATQSILDANGMTWESLIFPGDKLVIPGVATVSAASSGSSLNDEMRANAAVIVQVGREIGVPEYGIVIALATAMQESSMRNLNWGDRDSVGLFQQRPSSGWGSVEQLTTPRHAALLFYGGATNPNKGYTRGLLDISGWESMPLTVVAQRVQISACPDAYAKWEESARAWLAELG